mgnify:CR=1 FL=1
MNYNYKFVYTFLRRVLWFFSRHLTKISIPIIIKLSILFKNGWLIRKLLVLILKLSTTYWYFTNGISQSKKNNNIIFFGREIFNTDIKHIAAVSELRFLFFPQIVYNTIANTFIPEEIRSQIGYHLDDRQYQGKYINQFSKLRLRNEEYYEKKKEELKNFIKNFLIIFLDELNVNLIVSSNVQYYQDQEWINACNERAIPFIAMVKEGIGTANDTERQIDTFKQIDFKFKGRSILCYSEGVKKLLTKSSVFDKENIHVTGCARTDLIYKTNENFPFHRNRNRKLIIIFDFFEYASDKASFGGSKINLWNENINHIIKLAAKNLHYNFLIKTKDPSFTKAIIGYFKNAKNILISDNYKFDDIVKEALCIMGFRSTSLIKLMHTDLPIGIFAFKENLNSQDKDFMFDLKNNTAFNLISNFDDIENFILNADQYQTDNKTSKIHHDRLTRNSLIKDHLFVIDGKRSRNIAEFLVNIAKN